MCISSTKSKVGPLSPGYGLCEEALRTLFNTNSLVATNRPPSPMVFASFISERTTKTSSRDAHQTGSTL